MNLTINGATVDFELEREKDLGEVLYSLDRWLDGQGLIISDIDLDGEPVNGDIAAASKRSVDSVGRLDLRVERLSAFRGTALRNAAELLSRLGAQAQPPDAAGALSAASGFLDPEELSVMEMALSASGSPDSSESRAALDRARAFMAERLLESEDPRAQAKAAADAFRAKRESILNIPVWLQTGRDKDAMAAVAGFTEAFAKLLRLIPVLSESGVDLSALDVDGRPYSQFFSELNGALSELMRAFEARDTVLIGDLSEYEVLPRLDSVFAAVEKAIS